MTGPDLGFGVMDSRKRIALGDRDAVAERGVGEAGAGALAVVGHRSHAGDANMATLWKVVALGALMQGCEEEQFQRYIALGEHCLDGTGMQGQGDVSCEFGEVIKAYLLKAVLMDFLGDQDGFISCTLKAIDSYNPQPGTPPGSPQCAPSAASQHPGPGDENPDRVAVMDWFTLMTRLKPREPLQWNIPAWNETGPRGVNGLCKTLSIHLRASDVRAFMVTLEQLYAVTAYNQLEEPCEVNMFDLQLRPIHDALAILHNTACTDTSHHGALTLIYVKQWQAFVKMQLNQVQEGLALCRQVLSCVAKVPGVVRFTPWRHRVENVAFQLVHFGCTKDYEEARRLYNRYTVERKLPPYGELDMHRDFCSHFLCRTTLRRIGVPIPLTAKTAATPSPPQQRPAPAPEARPSGSAAAAAPARSSGEGGPRSCCSGSACPSALGEGSGIHSGPGAGAPCWQGGVGATATANVATAATTAGAPASNLANERPLLPSVVGHIPGQGNGRFGDAETLSRDELDSLAHALGLDLPAFPSVLNSAVFQAGFLARAAPEQARGQSGSASAPNPC